MNYPLLIDVVFIEHCIIIISYNPLNILKFMSHFTYMRTNFENISYLEKALNKLNILNVEQRDNVDCLKPNSYHINLTISQSNGHDITFVWNGQEYELVADMSFWEQSYSVKSFINKVAQKYAVEVIIAEGQKIGFEPVEDKRNCDESNTLTLERWNTSIT